MSCYNFNVERDAVTLREKSGRVDFKDISRVENVVAGQLLARKVPAEQGQPGQTVTGHDDPGSQGKDCELAVGQECEARGGRAFRHGGDQRAGAAPGRQDQRRARSIPSPAT